MQDIEIASHLGQQGHHKDDEARVALSTELTRSVPRFDCVRRIGRYDCLRHVEISLNPVGTLPIEQPTPAQSHGLFLGYVNVADIFLMPIIKLKCVGMGASSTHREPPHGLNYCSPRHLNISSLF
jgi:hypothetical protein